MLSLRRSSLGRAALLLVLAGTAVFSCNDEEVERTPVVLTIEDHGYAFTVDVNTFDMTFTRGEDVLTTLDGSSFVIGTVAQQDDTINYDPYPLLTEAEGYFPPEGLQFRKAERIVSASATGDSIELDLVHERGIESHLSIRIESEGHVRFHLVPNDAAKVAYLQVGAHADFDEAFYGLGELFDDVNQRGKLRAMQLEVDALESANNEAHVPIPFVIGTRGWGLFVESSYPGVFDVSATQEGRVNAMFGTGTASAGGIVAHLFGAEHPLDVTKRYYEVTGFPKLPAPWALGPLVWRDENDDQAQVESDLDTMRDLDLATNAIWIDRPYATGVNTFDFDPLKFADAQAMIDKAQALGFRVSLWHVPYLDDEDPSTQALRDEAEASGYYPLETGITLNKWGKPIDFTAPEAVEWWQGLLGGYIAMGIEGFKLDYAEDVVPGVFGARNVYRFRDGSDERTMHRGYTLLYHSTYADLLPEEGGFLLCRAGKYGDQKNGPIIWPGDLDARMWKHGETQEIDGDEVRVVGGLHASMVAGLTLGPSGFPFYGADTGGYRHAPPDKETFRRWFEQTALSSVMQIGTSANDVAWEFEDEALLDSYRFYTRLHLRLFPYEWTLANDMLETGRPIQRPFGLQYPEGKEHPSDEYFFGDSLLVAPITESGADQRELVLPDGDWVFFFDGTVAEGPGRVIVNAPLGTLPLFLKAGGIVPMLRPTIDTLSPTTEPERVDSFDTTAGPLWVLSTFGPASGFEIYDGTKLTQETGEDGVMRLTIEQGDTFTFGAVFDLVSMGAAPARVVLDGLTLDAVNDATLLDSVSQGYFFDPDDRGGSITIKVPAGDGLRRVNIEPAILVDD